MLSFINDDSISRQFIWLRFVKLEWKLVNFLSVDRHGAMLIYTQMFEIFVSADYQGYPYRLIDKSLTGWVPDGTDQSGRNDHKYTTTCSSVGKKLCLTERFTGENSLKVNLPRDSSEYLKKYKLTSNLLILNWIPYSHLNKTNFTPYRLWSLLSFPKIDYESIIFSVF